MVKGETVMPTPTGDITSTETWSESDAVSNQVAEEAQEDNTAGEADATEQAVVESGSEEEE
jgi:hypothetical protein